MTDNLPLARRGRGGNHHPLATKQFILDRLAQVGEDHIASLHRAHNKALNNLAEDRGRKYYYHHSTYASFHSRVWELISEGLIEFSGREEESDAPQFGNMEDKPMRRFLRLVRGK